MPAWRHSSSSFFMALAVNATIGMCVLAFVAFAGLFARFFYLQVVEHDHYQTLAETNRIAIVPIVPNRGVVTDRNGVVLAQSYSGYTLEIMPSKVKSLDETIDAIAEVVEVTPRDRKRFRKLLDESRNFESLPIRTRLTDEEVASVRANVFFAPPLDAELRAWVERHYRDRLTPADLADPQLHREGLAALDELSGILRLGSVYDFQR